MLTTKALGHEHFHRLAHKLGPRVAEDPLSLSIDHDDLAGPVDHHHCVWRSLDDQAQSPLTFAQCQLRCFALRDIDKYSREHHCSLVGLDRVQADFDRELVAILLEAVEIAPGPHRPRLGIDKICRSQPWVMTTKALGHEHFHRLAHKLGPRVTEDPLSPSIDHDDLAGPVDHHHGVWRRLDHQAEAPLALARRVGGLRHLAQRDRFGLTRLCKQHFAIAERYGLPRIDHGFELFFFTISKRHKRSDSFDSSS